MDLRPHVRFARFLEWKGWSQAQAAAELGCSRAFVSMIVNDVKLPGRLVANAIARHTALWPEGPIRSTEWDVVELERRAAPAEGSLEATGTGSR